MSTQQVPLTYEGILEMFRETREQMKESDRKFREMSQETDRKFQETSKKISALGSRIGEIIENMVAGNIVKKFQRLGYAVTECFPRKPFRNKKLGIRGEVDLFLDDGDDNSEIAILIEVKTTLEVADVREHIERLEKYRRYANAGGNGNKTLLIGAVAGAIVKENTAKFAQENGMYVIVQSGDAVEIVPLPEGFTAKEW